MGIKASTAKRYVEEQAGEIYAQVRELPVKPDGPSARAK